MMGHLSWPASFLNAGTLENMFSVTPYSAGYGKVQCFPSSRCVWDANARRDTLLHGKQTKLVSFLLRSGKDTSTHSEIRSCKMSRLTSPISCASSTVANSRCAFGCRCITNSPTCPRQKCFTELWQLSRAARSIDHRFQRSPIFCSGSLHPVPSRCFFLQADLQFSVRCCCWAVIVSSQTSWQSQQQYSFDSLLLEGLDEL